MKRLLRLAMGLYPSSWRHRYGVELQYLLEDAHAGWSDLFDILKGALQMRLTQQENLMYLARNFKIVMGAGALALLLFVGWEREAEPEYEATTLILIDPARVPDSAEPTLAMLGAKDRLGQINDQLMSQTRLQRIIDAYQLYPSLRGHKTQKEIIERMRSDISLELVHNLDGSGPLRGFRVTYCGTNPSLVAQVTNQLASLFIEENLKVREQRVGGTNEFLENRLSQLRERLKKQEAALRLAKSPDERDIQTRELALSREYYAKLYIQNLEAQTSAEIEKRQKSERFTILDPARIPEKPARYRPRFLNAGW